MVALVAFEALAVATAMPVAAAALGGVREYSLAFSLFLTASLFGSVAAGVWSDLAGPRRATVTGVLLFGTGLVVAGTATSFPVLIAGRVISGLGAGAMAVAIYLLIAAVYPYHLQPRMFSAVSAAWVLPSLVGPALAGLLTERLSWRAVFLVVLPPLPVVLWLLWPYLRGSADPVGGDRGTADPAVSRLVRGAVLAVGASLLQGGLVALSTPMGVVLVLGGLAAVLVSLPGLLPAGVLRLRRGLPALVGARMFYAGAFFGAEAFLPLMLVDHRGLGVGRAGLTLTIGAVGWSLGAWWQGRPRTSARTWNRLPWLGGLCLGLAVPLVALGALPQVPPPAVVPVWVLAGFGMGLAMSSTSVLLIRLSDVADQGRSVASVQIGDSLGGVLGIGVAGAVFAALHDPSSQDVAVYVLIWLALGLAGLSSTFAAARIGPARPAA